MTETDKKANASIDQVTDEYVLDRYYNSIVYYWKASNINKNAYKRSRYLTIVLGATLTLISSLATSKYLESMHFVAALFAIASPVLAAVLTVVGGFAQNFHWGATWRDMVLNAERLEKERDRYKATKAEERDNVAELNILNELIIEESSRFFQRVLDSEVKPKDD